MSDAEPSLKSMRACRRCGAVMPADASGSACWSCIRDLALGAGLAGSGGPAPDPAETGGGGPGHAASPRGHRAPGVDPGSTGSMRLGDYVLLDPIAHGGMGVVYRARQVGLDRTVALKLLLLGRYSSPDSVRRFRREAQSAAALRHPGIVSVYDVGEAEGQPFIAMEYVDGMSLSEVLREGPLTPARAAGYARAVAEALHYAHSRGVLHRDIKPSNVLLDGFDQVRITDFGLAKKLDGSSDMTMTGEMLGSPNYLSPEQAAGRHADVGPASDTYGIGALLYELLTGRPPFMAQSIQDTLLHIRDTEPVAPVRLNPAVPRDLNTIALKCLQKLPGRRYASAGELAEDLGRFLRHEPIQAHPASAWERNVKWVRRHRARAALVATIALSLIALTIGSLWFSFRVARARAETEAANRRLARDLFVREWADAEQSLQGEKTLPALTWFARTLRRHPSDHVVASRLLSLLGDLTLSIPVGEPLVHPNAVLGAAFSPDGRRMVTSCGDGRVRLWRWEAPSDPVVLPRDFESPAATWVPGIDRILVADHAGITRWTPEGLPEGEAPVPLRGVLRWEPTRDGQRAALFSSEAPPQLWSPVELRRVESPAFGDATVRTAGFGASGRFILHSWISEAGRRWNIGLWDVRTGRRVWEATPPEAPATFHVHSAAISDDDSLAALCRWGGQTVVYRLPSLTDPTGPAVGAGRPLLRWDFGEVTRVEAFRFLDRNRRLLVATSDGLVQQFDLETGQLLPDRIEHSGQVNAAAVSPDEATLATASVDGGVRFWDLRVGRPEPVVLQRSNVVWDVAFAPGGSELVLAGPTNAAVFELATGAERRRLHTGKLVSRVAYSPDGRRIATSTERGQLRIWDAATGEPVTDPLPVALRIHDLSYSADGRWILLGGPDDRVRVLDADTAKPVFPDFVVGAALVEAVVTADGTRLVAGTVHGDVHFWSLPDARVIPAQGRHRGVVWATRASRDGRLVATTSGDQTTLVWDVASARVRHEFRSEKAVYSAVFSPDGRRIVLGSADRTARLRDLGTGRPIGEVMRHPGGVWFVQFSPDGRLVATGDDAGFARLWDAETGLPLGNWLRSGSTLKRIAFSPDGRRIATVSSDGTGRIWPVVVAPSPAPGWLPELAEAVAGRRLDEDGSLRSVPFGEWRALRERFGSGEGSGPGPGPGSDFYGRWARWFFRDRLAEHPAPFRDPP